MNIFESEFHETSRQYAGNYQSAAAGITLTGVLVDVNGGEWANCTVQASKRAFAVDVEAADLHLQAKVRAEKINTKLPLPVGDGDIRINGKVIANYISCGCIKPVKGEPIRVVRDDSGRRFLWARAHGCTYRQACGYAHFRDSFLLCGQLAFASFAGYHKKNAPFFTSCDRKAMEHLTQQEQWCILVMCFMHNLYGSDMQLHHDESDTSRGMAQESDLGRPIPDIPSFVPAPGKSGISIAPADVHGHVPWGDRFLQFINSTYQYTVGIPFYIMTIPMVRQCIPSPGFSAWGTPEWIVVVLWTVLLLLFIKYLLFPAYKADCHFPSSRD